MQLPWRLFAGILVFWVLIGFVPFLIWSDLHSAADFANTFGFVNALFAALAFGGVIWAIRLQTRELELQRFEIEETRDELRRSADAQHQSQQMHFLTALLTARNNVTQGYAAAAGHEEGPIRSNLIAHRQHLAELEWLLDLVDRHDSNPFALPDPELIVAHQLSLLLKRSYPLLKSAVQNRATNHARNLLLDLNQSLRELRRILVDGNQGPTAFAAVLDKCISQAETISTANEFEEVGEICQRVFDELSRQAASQLGADLPMMSTPENPAPERK